MNETDTDLYLNELRFQYWNELNKRIQDSISRGDTETMKRLVKAQSKARTNTVTDDIILLLRTKELTLSQIRKEIQTTLSYSQLKDRCERLVQERILKKRTQEQQTYYTYHRE